MISLSKMNKTHRLIPRMHKASTMKKAASEKNNEEPSPGFIAKTPKVQSPEKPLGTEEPQKVERVEREWGKIVVYTCITGGYDNLIQPVKTPGVDYICFTDNTSVDPKGWELKPMPDGLEGLTNVKKQRMVKVLAHRYLSEYDISIWVDGSVAVKDNVKNFLKDFIYDGHSIFIPEHPVRNCIYKECEVVKKIKKDTTDLPDKQMKKYKGEGFPEKYGLVQSNIMIRWHNNEDCKEVMEAWAAEVREFSHRDQLSFNYALWKTKATCFKAIDKKTCNSKYFKWNVIHNIKPQVKSIKKK